MHPEASDVCDEFPARAPLASFIPETRANDYVGTSALCGPPEGRPYEAGTPLLCSVRAA